MKKAGITRVDILKEALDILNTNKNIVPKQATSFARVSSTHSRHDPRFLRFREYVSQTLPFHTDQLKRSKETTCEVCGLGTLLLADINKRNRVTIRSFVLDGAGCGLTIRTRLSDFFSHEELIIFEAVFEGWNKVHFIPPGTWITTKSCELNQHVDKIVDARKRLKMMLKFVISKRGLIL